MINSNRNIPIIYYHSISPEINQDWNRSFLTLELKYFEEHLKYLSSNNYKAIFLDEYFNLTNSELQKNKYVVITFDDGFVDNYIFAYPLLKKYNMKGTIFISPDFVNTTPVKNKTLLDYWANKASFNELNKSGFISWEELNEIFDSGIIDVQSHTMTHTKYFVSDRLIGFHHPKSDSLYAISNYFPLQRPFHISDPNFEKLIPFGFPLFEESSSVIAKKVSINEDFIQKVVKTLSSVEWDNDYNFITIFKLIEKTYSEMKESNLIIDSVESENDYQIRVYNELKDSKYILETKLSKKVEYLCWPHGDCSEFTHKTALDVGYKATTLGKMSSLYFDDTRFERFGVSHSKNNIFLTKLKMKYKIESYRKKNPYYLLKKNYEFIRDL